MGLDYEPSEQFLEPRATDDVFFILNVVLFEKCLFDFKGKITKMFSMILVRLLKI